MCQWIYISDKGHLKAVFAVGSHHFLCFLAAGTILSFAPVSTLKSPCHDDRIINVWFNFLVFCEPLELLCLFRFHVNVQI